MDSDLKMCTLTLIYSLSLELCVFFVWNQGFLFCQSNMNLGETACVCECVCVWVCVCTFGNGSQLLMDNMLDSCAFVSPVHLNYCINAYKSGTDMAFL